MLIGCAYLCNVDLWDPLGFVSPWHLKYCLMACCAPHLRALAGDDVPWSGIPTLSGVAVLSTPAISTEISLPAFNIAAIVSLLVIVLIGW